MTAKPAKFTRAQLLRAMLFLLDGWGVLVLILATVAGSRGEWAQGAFWLVWVAIWRIDRTEDRVQQLRKRIDRGVTITLVSADPVTVIVEQPKPMPEEAGRG